MQAAGAVFKLLQGKAGKEPAGKVLTRDEILAWLREEETWKLDFLWEDADRVRREHVGDEVHLRGLIELSNYCRRDCHYCGIRAGRKIERYRMTEDEVVDCVRTAQKLGYGTVVLQSGEDLGLTTDSITGLVRRIKEEAGLAVTLSLGERSRDELAKWREAGADRYLLKHETSDPALFRRIHPEARDMAQGHDPNARHLGSCPEPAAPSPPKTALPSRERRPESEPSPRRGEGAGEGSSANERIALLKQLRELGYEIGSGVMVGIPGQTYESLADDIMLFRDLDLDMVGCGPFVPHPDTPLGNLQSGMPGPRLQLPATDMMTTKVVALTRLVCPDANIPSTTALATVNREHGRELGLERGANVWMPNLTPLKYRALYEIYPGKTTVIDTAEEFHENLLATLAGMGRVPGRGPGGRKRVAKAECSSDHVV